MPRTKSTPARPTRSIEAAPAENTTAAVSAASANNTAAAAPAAGAASADNTASAAPASSSSAAVPAESSLPSFPSFPLLPSFPSSCGALPNTAPAARIAWTTLATKAAALAFADALLGTRLAACAQVEGPLLSCYPWQGQRQHEEEWRVTLKFPIENAAAVEAWLLANHPYETPQWLAVDAAQIAPAYLAWLRTETTTPPQLAPATGTAPVPALPRKFFQKPA